MLSQKHWRIGASISIVLAAAMAWYSVRSGILRDSVAHLLSFTTEKVAQSAINASLPYCIAYWVLFFALIGVSLYTAMLDMRYIRLQYASGKREILKRTLDDPEFRETLIDSIHKKKP